MAPAGLPIATDTVSEFPQAADQPESDQDGDSGEREFRFPDGPDEFANSISRRTKNNAKLESAGTAKESFMAGFKAISLFLLGMLAGLGVATVVVAHIEPGEIAVKFGTLNTFLAGALLLIVSLVGGVAVAKGERTRRLGTALGGIAFLAILLTVAVGLRRRAEQLGGLQRFHQTQFQMQSMKVVPGRADFAAQLRLAHWHNEMSNSFRRASSRPWLSVPKPEPCTCPVCAASGGPQSEGE
jgi:hypothetical protein